MDVFRSEYEDWQRLCAWLEDQPYNAAYDGIGWPKGVRYLLRDPREYTVKADGRRAYDAVKRWYAIRHAYALVYWASGYGWRLRKDYRAELERMAQHVITEEPV